MEGALPFALQAAGVFDRGGCTSRERFYESDVFFFEGVSHVAPQGDDAEGVFADGDGDGEG